MKWSKNNRVVKNIGRAVLISLGLFSSCIYTQKTETDSLVNSSEYWEDQLDRKLEAFGHRNWVLVVDSAFPEQNGDGMEMLLTEKGLLDVLEKVLGKVENAPHLHAVVYRDKELDYLNDGLVQGIEDYKKDLSLLLEGNAVQAIAHEDIFTKLDQESALFRVLVIKTRETLPYTSVFLQLDCGYWGPEQEVKLRDLMRDE